MKLMSLEQFNHAHATELATVLNHCVPIQAWADALILQRPFCSTAQLVEYAAQQADTWTWSDIEAALAHHPRIGERQAQQSLSETEQRYSAQEQALIYADQTQPNAENQQSNQTDTSKNSMPLALLQGNQAYEDRFGFIFLIKAAGLSQAQILAALASRLHNDLDTEKHIVQQQLKAIALLRLTQELQA